MNKNKKDFIAFLIAWSLMIALLSVVIMIIQFCFSDDHQTVSKTTTEFQLKEGTVKDLDFTDFKLEYEYDLDMIDLTIKLETYTCPKHGETTNIFTVFDGPRSVRNFCTQCFSDSLVEIGVHAFDTIGD